jgi:integrase
MPSRPYAAVATIPTTQGTVVVRKAWAGKQGTFVAVLDGPNEALRACLPRWRPRTPSSRRVQITPPKPIEFSAEVVSWIATCVPKWSRAAQGDAATATATLITIKDSIAETEKTLAGTVRPGTVMAYRKQWARIGRSLPWRTHLTNLTRDRIQALVGSLAASGYAATTIRSALVALHRALVPAIEAGQVDVRIFQHIALPKPIRRHRPQLTKAQRDNLIRVAGEHGRDAHLLFAIGLLAGLRRGELLSLQWQAVDLDHSILHVRNTNHFTTKSGKPRVVPICGTLASILSHYRPAEVAEGTFIIAPQKPPRKGLRWAFRKTFEKVTETAGVGWLSVHGMRRMFATLGAQSGISVWKLKSWMGHASVRTTEDYTDEAKTFDPDVERLIG